MTPSTVLPDEIRDVARALCGEPVTGMSEIRRGGNSRIFRVQCRSGGFALKKYPAADNRNRLEAEVNALRFMERQNIDRTPRVAAVAPEQRFALLTWLEGEAVAEASDRDVADFAGFQIALDAVIDARARSEIGEASEACLSGPRIVAQIERRYARLEAVKHEVPEFAAFFDGVLVPALGRYREAADATYRRLGLDFSVDLPPEFRTLIPSDMGIHNALRGPDGRLRFLDFEYFGWDDPLTSIANFVMHPGMRLSAGQKAAYREALLGHFRRHAEAERLAALLPLYGLRWCAIILGELLPERWRHRQESNAALGTWEQARREQIGKARAVMAELGA
ncbi:phosphotransferase family protein [Reyranella sp.]|uniref:phosphotransferase family protein n=1 Tax=Reyranella sp. TaxID=1929291 RepID=UPI003BAA24DC